MVLEVLCVVNVSLCVLQEKEVAAVLGSAVERCLVLGSGDNHQWNTQLLDELTEKYSTIHV